MVVSSISMIGGGSRLSSSADRAPESAASGHRRANVEVARVCLRADLAIAREEDDALPHPHPRHHAPSLAAPAPRGRLASDRSRKPGRRRARAAVVPPMPLPTMMICMGLPHSPFSEELRHLLSLSLGRVSRREDLLGEVFSGCSCEVPETLSARVQRLEDLEAIRTTWRDRVRLDSGDCQLSATSSPKTPCWKWTAFNALSSGLDGNMREPHRW